MDQSTAVVLSVALLLAANNAVVRLPLLQDRASLFWAVQLLDIGASLALFFFGIPGFDEIPAVSWMLSLLFILHVAQNLRWRAERRRSRGVSSAVEERRSAIRAALKEEEAE